MTLIGEFFSTRVQLGGRLFATEDVTEDTVSSSKDMAKSMKYAASASFSTVGSSASVSASAGSGGTETKQGSRSDSSMSLTWQANGGDTLLCNKPNEWAATVSYHWNWRITKQDNIYGILDVIARTDGMDWIVAEAAKWGVKVAAIDEIPTMKANTSLTTAFTLNAEGVPGGRYMLAFSPTACDLCQSSSFPLAHHHTAPSLTVRQTIQAKAMNAAGLGSFTINSSLQSRGCVLLGPKTARSKDVLRLFEVEDETGRVINEVKYNTKYRLRNKESGLYINYFWEQYVRFLCSSSGRSATTRFIAFKDPRGSIISTDVIPDGTTVHIRFYEVKDGEVLGYLIVCLEDKDYAYLGVSKPEDDDKMAAKLVIRYNIVYISSHSRGNSNSEDRTRRGMKTKHLHKEAVTKVSAVEPMRLIDDEMPTKLAATIACCHR
ncbi:hypothetical protein L249_2920 [Ophiocordyceps polyrhachis-furcata BCC 54312]|uniref:Uncharacterized protein n=1 Tax=Ophiocordyceps polyrhachis-furcata BCC 54312 TaxID=1330021 RepID=A0A367LQ50_9HYPO|nr:hypothetical protein L249_2920 [Ophiocordyceps polyrhachis-furcata BCC 54312]